jgi:TolA-binding protein
VFDDEQVTPGGLTVQCTNCGHVFRVKVKELVVTVPVKPGELDGVPIPATAASLKPAAASPSAPAPPPADEKAREWRVRQANGNVFTFKELTTLQKWIVEQKVARDDEISQSGDQWKRLGNIGELASFFQVVEAAESARAHPAMPAVTPIPMPNVSVYPVIQAPPGYPSGYPSGYPQASFPPPPPSFAVPPPAMTPAPPPRAPSAARPSHTAREARPVGRAAEDVKPDEADLAAVRRGRGWVVFVVLLVVAAGGAGGLYVWSPDLLGLAPRADLPGHEVPITFEKPPLTAPPAGDPVSPPAEKEAPPLEAAPLPAPLQEGEAPSPKAPDPVAKPEPDEAQPAPPPARGPKQLLADAQRLRERGAFDKAVDLYERVIQAQPGNARALAGRGLCYLDLQQYALAEQSFRAALQADPEEADALLGLAEAARYQGKKSEAIQHYERYLALHPDGEDAVAARNAIQQLKE